MEVERVFSEDKERKTFEKEEFQMLPQDEDQVFII